MKEKINTKLKEKSNNIIRKSIIFALVMILSISVATPASVAAASGKSLTVTIKGVKISKNKATLAQKKTAKLIVKYKGRNVTAKASYKSSKPKIVSVSKKGTITAKKKGQCSITIKYKKLTRKLKLTVKSKKTAKAKGFPVGTYSYVPGTGFYRGSLKIDSAGNATYTEWSGSNGQGTRIKYKMTMDNTVTTPDGVTAYLLRFVKGDEIQLGSNGFNVVKHMNSGNNRHLIYDTNKRILKDENGLIWQPVS